MAERPPRTNEERSEFAEERESLWRITLAPLAWAVHFMLCYGAVAVACEKTFLPVDPTRHALIALTVVVLAFIAWIGWRSLQQWDVRRTGNFSNPYGEAEDRHQFLGHAAFLLALISFIGVVYVSFPLLLVRSCA